jgi:hypothetical protein
MPNDEFTEDGFEWTQYYEDPTPPIREGDRILVDDDGIALIQAMDKMGINFNWHHLHNMAQPIVDEQLGRLTMHHIWRNTPVKLNLGVLFVDTMSTKHLTTK